MNLMKLELTFMMVSQRVKTKQYLISISKSLALLY